MGIVRPLGSVLPASAGTIGRAELLRPALPARVFAASTLAGGIFFGGFLVAAATLFDQLIATSVTIIAPIMFAVGTMLGAAHGAALGIIGRPANMQREVAYRSLLMGAILAVAGALISAPVSLSIAVSRWSVLAMRPPELAAVFLTWTVGVAISAWCTIEVTRVLSNALDRWPERRQGVPLAAVTFVALTTVFLILRPEIWFTDLRVSPAGAVLMALGLTLWVAVPAEVALLHLLHRRRAAQAVVDKQLH